MRTILALPLLLATVSAASAQTVGNTPAARPVTQPLGGPAVPGVCLVSREAIFANAAVGKAATARLQELARAAQVEVDAERKPIEDEANAIPADTKATPDQRRTREQALAARVQPLQVKAQQRAAEIEATRTKALARIADEAQPVIAEVYAAHKCGLLFDRNVALGGNFTHDLTADVVKGLDAKIQTISFERERPPAQPATPAPR